MDNEFKNNSFENIYTTSPYPVQNQGAQPCTENENMQLDQMNFIPVVSNCPQDVSPDVKANTYEWGMGARTQYYRPESAKVKETKKKTPVALILVISILVSTVFGGVSGFLAYKFLGKQENSGNRTSGEFVQNSSKPQYELSGEVLSTEEIVEITADSVVEIVTESMETGMFYQQYVTPGAGSGVIVDSDGLIVTNHHVIEGVNKITVTLRSGESFDAEIVGSDSQTDLALIRIDTEGLVEATLGDSDNLRIGEKTIAIGNPLGRLGGTVTEGILSALNRNVVVDGQTRNLLQTDTAINPGNSGGGLFNSQGFLVGIVSAKSTGSEVEGLGYAIPINDVVEVISDLAKYGYVRGRVDIGMEFIDVDSTRTAWMYNLSELGCYIYSVDRDSNAYKSGLRSGDLILAIDGVNIETSSQIEEILNGKAVGDELLFTVNRDGKQEKFILTLAEDVSGVISEDSAGSAVDWYGW